MDLACISQSINQGQQEQQQNSQPVGHERNIPSSASPISPTVQPGIKHSLFLQICVQIPKSHKSIVLRWCKAPSPSPTKRYLPEHCQTRTTANQKPGFYDLYYNPPGLSECSREYPGRCTCRKSGYKMYLHRTFLWLFLCCCGCQVIECCLRGVCVYRDADRLCSSTPL